MGDGADELYPRFSPEEHDRRLGLIAELLEREGLDALVLFGWSATSRAAQADVHYVSHYLGMRDNYVVVSADAPPVLFAQSYNHVPNASRVSVLDDVRWGGPNGGTTVGEELVVRGARRVGVVGWMPYQHHAAMLEAAAGASFRDVTAAFRRLRVLKSREEIGWLERGAAVTDAALVALRDTLRPGLREREIGEIAASASRAAGAVTGFEYVTTTSMHDPSSSVPAQVLSNRVLRPGDVVTVELSASYEGYAGQALRSFAVGEDPPALFRSLHDTAVAVFERLRQDIRAGATTDDVFRATDLIDEAGFTVRDAVLHGFGIGLLPPSCGTRHTPHANDPWTFSAGETIVVQPNVVTPDERAGVQTGELCEVTEDGLRSLHSFPLEFVRV